MRKIKSVRTTSTKGNRAIHQFMADRNNLATCRRSSKVINGLLGGSPIIVVELLDEDVGLVGAGPP